MATTPHGLFRLRADSSALAAWARESASLPGPTPRAGTGSDGALEYSASVLGASDGNAMRLLRLTGDSTSAYALRASNGAWEGGDRVRPEIAKALFRALTGGEGDGVEWHPDPPHDDSFPPGYKNAEPAPGNPRPRYPARAELAGASGAVVAQFTKCLGYRYRRRYCRSFNSRCRDVGRSLSTNANPKTYSGQLT